MLMQNFLVQQSERYDALTRVRRRVQRRALALRYAKLIGYLLLLTVFCFGAALFAWTAGNIPPPVNDPNFPLPSWWWTASMIIVAVCNFACMAGLLWPFLDDLYLTVSDTVRFIRRS
jgi:hypothetical protein